MIEKFQQKRTVLVAQREQVMAQFNLTNGAIAMLDELIAEEVKPKAPDAKRKSVAAKKGPRRRSNKAR
jgi:hypothetical protein